MLTLFTLCYSRGDLHKILSERLIVQALPCSQTEEEKRRWQKRSGSIAGVFEYTAGFTYLADKSLSSEARSGPNNANLLRN